MGKRRGNERSDLCNREFMPMTAIEGTVTRGLTTNTGDVMTLARKL